MPAARPSIVACMSCATVQLDFKSFVHDILGLPHDFFDMDLMSHQGPSGTTMPNTLEMPLRHLPIAAAIAPPSPPQHGCVVIMG